jgi:hypothetical protein
MKILFLSPATRPDFQCDILFHGLRTLYGNDCVDYPRLNYMYRDYPDRSNLYGLGFTLYGLLNDDSGVERDKGLVENGIREHLYDLIVYGSIHRSQEFFKGVTAKYAPHEILFIDGEDHQSLLDITRHGIYFKRELSAPSPGVYPIHFAIPTEKIGTLRPLTKNKILAHIDPRDRSTYVYSTEKEYYSDYASSLFAYTMKKGGWDCLRHYEIMANGCIPVFLGIGDCPATTLVNLPKPELLEALDLWNAHHPASYWESSDGHSVWLSLWRRIHLRFAALSTTWSMAQRVIETQQRVASLENEQ